MGNKTIGDLASAIFLGVKENAVFYNYNFATPQYVEYLKEFEPSTLMKNQKIFSESVNGVADLSLTMMKYLRENPNVALHAATHLDANKLSQYMTMSLFDTGPYAVEACLRYTNNQFARLIDSNVKGEPTTLQETYNKILIKNNLPPVKHVPVSDGKMGGFGDLGSALGIAIVVGVIAVSGIAYLALVEYDGSLEKQEEIKLNSEVEKTKQITEVNAHWGKLSKEILVEGDKQVKQCLEKGGSQQECQEIYTQSLSAVKLAMALGASNNETIIESFAETWGGSSDSSWGWTEWAIAGGVGLIAIAGIRWLRN